MARKKQTNILENINNIFGIIGTIILIILLLMIFTGNLQLNIPFINLPNLNDNNEPIPTLVTSCEETDSGRDIFNVGHIIVNEDLNYYDECQDGTILTEFYCLGNQAKQENIACPLGYECVQTRSGGYCNLLPPTHNNGDYLGGGSGSGSTYLPSNNFEIDLGDITEGNCKIGATLSTSWNYAGGECQGIQGSEGVIWELFDSDSSEYLRVDGIPVALSVDLGCGLDYDGTPWRLTMNKLLNMPECELDYEWEVRVIACECQ